MTGSTMAPESVADERGGTLDRALALVRFLRENCPWDAKQTARSLVPHLLEESHEVVDAILDDDRAALEGELGDLLLNLAFQIVVAEEEEDFSARSVVERLEEKMKRRHPHLFGLGERESWETLKARERSDGGGVLSDLPGGLDPLTRAHRIQERVSGVGFDWADHRGALDKVREELEEVREALGERHEPGGAAEPDAVPPGRAEVGEAQRGDARPGEAQPSDRALEEELGDLLFAVVNLVRLTGLHPTTSLARANRKFERRFERLEEVVAARGLVLGEADLEALDAIWDRVKEEEEGS